MDAHRPGARLEAPIRRNQEPPQRLLFRVAGAPDCRKAYQANLEDAKATVAYCQDLVNNPGHGGQGTGEELETRRRNLERALEALAWRQQLWDSLPKPN